MTQAAKTRKIFDGRYEILSIVGRGARSVVYHARHAINPTQEVALKVLLESKKGQTSSGERLRREALAMVSSRSKYVVRLDDFHSVGALCYLSMEFAPESDLRAYCRKMGGRLKPAQAERFMRQTAEALSYVHKAGIIHRDVKPDNILVLSEKEIRLTDFGVSLLPGEECSLEELQSGVGTMNYMGPEVLEGKRMDERSDIYSLGVVYYEVISGVNPFDQVPLAKQMDSRHIENIPPLASLIPEVPEHLSAAIAKAMSFDPQKRFASAKELAQTLIAARAAAAPEKAASARGAAPVQHKAPKSEPGPEPKSKKEQPAVKPAAPEAEPKDSSPAPAARAETQDFSSALEQISSAQTVYIKNKQAGQAIQIAAQTQPPVKPPPAIKNLKTAVLAVAALLLIAIFVPPIVRHFDLGRSLARLTSAPPDSPIPAFRAASFDFPALPAGMYSGTIKDFIPGQTQPLVLVSFEERDELAVILGIEGWVPAVVNPRRARQEAEGALVKPLRVASSGFIIEFTGQSVDGEIFGYYTNIVNGRQGEWRAEPVR